MNQQLATLEQYIRLKYSNNKSEFAREYGIKPGNVARMLNGMHYVDMTNGMLLIQARNQQESLAAMEAKQ